MKKKMILALVCVMGLSVAGCGSEAPVTTPSNQEKIIINQPDGTPLEEAAEESTEAAEAAAEVNVSELAAALLNDIAYTDQLGEVDLETAKMFLNLADVDVSECAIYESSGATAEEIVVIKCADVAGADKVQTAFTQRVEEQTENFTDYVPEEVPKLNDAVIKVSDVYAVLSVSGDSAKAKEIIAGYLK